MSHPDRVHEPSPIRLLRAREDGQVARSNELSRALVTCLVLGGLLLGCGTWQESLTRYVRLALSTPGVSLSTAGEQVATLVELLVPVIFFLAAIMVLAVLVWHFQSPLCLRPDRIVPSPDRLSPVHFAKRLFSLHHWLKIGWLFLGFLLATVIVVGFTFNHSSSLALMASEDLTTALRTTTVFLRHALIGSGGFLVLFGAGDYIRERIRLASQLKMSDQERRDEARNSEMDPNVRRRLLG